MRTSKVSALTALLLLALATVTAVSAAGPVQIIGPTGACNSPTPCLYPDLIGVDSGAAAGSAFSRDSNGNLIALVSCSNFSNVCSTHNGLLTWSNNGGITWNNCVFAGSCSTELTTHPLQNPGSTCIHAGAIYISGSTVDVAYQNSAVNGVANFYVDRFQITYSGSAITDIANTGSETAATGINDQTTSGFSCVQQVLQTPNHPAGKEIMVFAVEENSGPLYMFVTGTTSSAFFNLAGTASAVSSTITSQNDGSNSCSQFQPSTGDIWNFDVYDRTGGTVFVNQYPFNSGANTWGAVTTHSLGANTGTPLLTKTLSCAVDSANAYFSWFNCLHAGVVCGTGQVSGNTCTWQLWDATPTSSLATPNQLATLTDSAGACHASQNNSNSGSGSSLTSLNGQLYLTGVDDNLFGTGCSSEGGADDTKCQQLFLAKYTVAGNIWGTMTQYGGNPSAVIGEAAFSNSNNYYLLYSTCNNYSGAANANDGACGVASGNSLQFNPILVVPPTVTGNWVSGAVAASGLVLVLMVLGMAIIAKNAADGNLDPEFAKGLIATVIIVGVMFLIVIGLSALFGGA